MPVTVHQLLASLGTFRPASLAPAVLLVAGHDRKRRVCFEVLQTAGFRLIEANSVEDAWRAVLHERPDVVITEVALPDGDGYELTRRIKAELPIALTRVVQFSSRFADWQHRVTGLQSGADHCLSDTANPQEVLAVVSSVLRAQRTEALLDMLLDSAPILVTGADKLGRITVFNAACEAMTGYLREDVIGRPFIDTLVTPDDRDAVRQRFRAATASELAAPHENRWRTATGDDRLIEWRCFPVAPPDGSDPMILGIGQDITDARRAEEARRESERRLQAVVDSAPAVIYVVDREGRFLLINHRFAELFGLDRQRVIGRSLHDVFPAEIADAFAAHNARVLAEGVRMEFDEQAPHTDGIHTYISVKVPLYDDRGDAYAICGVSTDITDRQQLTTALADANRQKDTIIATVVHELKQPLAPIVTAVELMKLRTSRTAGERARAVIERQVHQMQRLIDDLLDATRIAEGKVELRHTAVDMRELIGEARQVVQPMCDDRRQQLITTVPPDLPARIEGDPQRLQQVLSNLLTNASKYTDEGGRIELLLEGDESVIVMRVRDTGRGIPRDMLPRLFEPFVQGATDRGGLGLGLAVVRRLVEMHGGTVEARSEGPGTGSEFVVRLPGANRS